MLRFGAEIAAKPPQVRPDGGGVIDQCLRRIGIGADRGSAAAINVRLLPADLVARVAQKIHVIEIDAGDDRAIGVEQIHRIEPSAQPDFEHGRIEFRSSKQPRRGERPHLEVGERHVATRRLDCLERVDQLLIGRFAPVDPHPFVVTQQVWRGIETDAIPSGAQHCFEHRAGRTFAVGAADDEHHTHRSEGEAIAYLADTIEAQIDRHRMLAFEPLQPRVKRRGMTRHRIGSTGGRAARPRASRVCGSFKRWRALPGNTGYSGAGSRASSVSRPAMRSRS